MTSRPTSHTNWLGLLAFAILSLILVVLILNWHPDGEMGPQAIPASERGGDTSRRAAQASPARADGPRTDRPRPPAGDGATPASRGGEAADPQTARPGRGRVIDGNGDGVSGATVVVRTATRVQQVYSDGAGWFRLSGSDGGMNGEVPLSVQASSARHAPSQVVEITSIEPILRLGPGGMLTGRVVDTEGRSVASALVEIHPRRPTDPGAALLGALQPAYTQPDGRFSLGPLMPGRFDVFARPPQLAPGEVRDVEVRAAATTADLVIRVGEGARMEGRITAAVDGRAVPDARVAVIGNPSGHAAEAMADGDGRYLLEGLDGGATRIRVTATGFLAEIAGPLDLQPGGRLHLDIELRRPADARPVAVARIGASLRETPDGLLVGSVDVGGLAAEAGLQAGDRVISVDFQASAGLRGEEIATRLGADHEAPFTLEIDRPGAGPMSVYLPAAQ